MLAVALAAGLLAPPLYVTSNYGLSFRPPAATYYCPLPKGWVGSDHGTVLFLTKPTRCGDAGYPSSSRDFEPHDLPRISVYYGYALPPEDRPKHPPPCVQVGKARLVGALRAVCREMSGGMVRLSVEAEYNTRWPGQEVTVSLVTPRPATAREVAAFRAVAASIAPCSTVWEDDKGKRSVIGTGPRCPRDGRWF
jgi:hypothetical protein